MPFVIKPSRNLTLQKAWADLRKEQRAEKKAQPEEPAAAAAPAKKAAKKQPTRKGKKHG